MSNDAFIQAVRRLQLDGDYYAAVLIDPRRTLADSGLSHQESDRLMGDFKYRGRLDEPEPEPEPEPGPANPWPPVDLSVHPRPPGPTPIDLSPGPPPSPKPGLPIFNPIEIPHNYPSQGLLGSVEFYSPFALEERYKAFRRNTDQTELESLAGSIRTSTGAARRDALRKLISLANEGLR